MLVSLNYFVFLPYIFSAMFKQQGYDVKELPEEDCDLFIDCSGTLKVTSYKKNYQFLEAMPVRFYDTYAVLL